MFNIVLVEPEIPANTGNMARTCAVTGAQLHLIEPLGFSLDDKLLKRAGLDYWEYLNVRIYKNLREFMDLNSLGRFFYLSKKVERCYSEASFVPEDFFVFGKETKGLPEELIKNNQSSALRIPMLEQNYARSLNLSNAVSVVLYEALRQNSFGILK